MNSESRAIVVKPLTLEGTTVRLEPLRLEHAPLLWDVVKNDTAETFRWIPYSMARPEDFQVVVEKALAELQRGESLPFATVEKRSGRVIGSTRYMNIDMANRKVEIGSTWIAPAWQRSAINTEAKYLMIRQAFEDWGCLRVELKTDSLNQKSRNAILRIGAKEEGTLRQHMIVYTGRLRDTVYFGILDKEWPGVKAKLEAMLAGKIVSKNV